MSGIIISCGDSWTYNSSQPRNLIKRTAYRTIVSQRLGLHSVNLSKPNTSIHHLAYQIPKIKRIAAKFNLPVYTVFGLTVPSRMCVESESGFKQTVSAHSYDEKNYTSWAHNVFTDQFLAKQACITLGWIQAQMDTPYCFMNALCTFSDFKSSIFSQYLDKSKWLIDPEWSAYGSLFGLDKFDFSKTAILEKTKHGKQCRKKYMLEDGHPNELGNKLIADYITQPLRTYFSVDKV